MNRTATTNRRRRRQQESAGGCFGCGFGVVDGAVPLLAVGFLVGCLVSSTFYLGFVLPLPSVQYDHQQHDAQMFSTRKSNSDHNNILTSSGKQRKILVAIASFDFSQLPHLEDVLDGYADIALMAEIECVDVVIHTTIPYPITVLDLLNDRYKHYLSESAGSDSTASSLSNSKFKITIELTHPSIRLHLVDLHRTLFYQQLQNYDLFIYTEDDIRVTPRTISSYWMETQLLQERVTSLEVSSFNYNVGIVRYEYNFPSNVVMDDKTRHATQNVTRVYWEHSSHIHPAMPESVDQIPQQELKQYYVHMKNHHQGMYIATPQLLQAWKEKESCHFDVVTNRPGKGNQPTEGTQRVWMSSQQLFGKHHCNIQQILPLQGFTSLAVWHLPNKNYRRVGKFRQRQFSDGSEVFETPPNLLTELDLHLELQEKVLLQSDRTDASGTTTIPYHGVLYMTDAHLDRTKGWGRELLKKLGTEQEYYNMLERRMKDYRNYVARGGRLSKEDLKKTALVDMSPPSS